MKRSLVLCAALTLAACGASETPPPSDEAATTLPADSTDLEGTPRAGVVPAVQQRADQAEADMAARAREAEAQVQAAEGNGTSQP
ncbi:hypothetical protein [Longimicrobium sp.]|uniref:hypothetical protein n=1 Tax=Longimicrobium sp. TaxID=2029185 RepID=UPI002E38236D|nr:hypothetical protein [Longimicrobium sp.]HEX6042439.1 hypothetical protein [Longimicrobium sp.]